MNDNNNLFSIPFIGTPTNNNQNNNMDTTNNVNVEQKPTVEQPLPVENNPELVNTIPDLGIPNNQIPIDNGINSTENMQSVPNMFEQKPTVEQPLPVENNTELVNTIPDLGIPNNQIPIDNGINNTENDDLEKTVIMSSLLLPQNNVEVDNTNNLGNAVLTNTTEPLPVENNTELVNTTSDLGVVNNQIPIDNGMNSDSENQIKPDLLKTSSSEEEKEENNIVEQSGVPDLLAVPQVEEKQEEIDVNIDETSVNNGLISPIENISVNTVDNTENVQEMETVLPNSFENNSVEEQQEIQTQLPDNPLEQLSISSLALGTTENIDSNKDAIDSTVSNMLNNLDDNESDFIEPDNEELLREFMGDKYYVSGRHKFFNIWGFLFGPFYLVYRKMYLLGIIFLIALSVIGMFLNQVLTYIILGGVIGLFFNLLYGIHANIKIKKIKRKYKNTKLEPICRKKGGTSIINVILSLILYIVIMIILTITLGINSFANNLVKMLEINKGNTPTDKYKDHTDYYIGKFRVFMDNTDPTPGDEITISDTNLLMVVMPKAKNDGDYVTCVLDNRQSEWHNGEGLFKDGSTNCKEYMENAEKYITADMYPFPDSATISFNINKELGPGTILTYGKDRCMYNQEKKEFECKE